MKNQNFTKNGLHHRPFPANFLKVFKKRRIAEPVSSLVILAKLVWSLTALAWSLVVVVVLVYPLVVLVCTLVVLVSLLVVLACPLVVLICPFVCPFVVLVCPLVISVCPFVVPVVLSVGLFITDLKNDEKCFFISSREMFSFLKYFHFCLDSFGLVEKINW